MGLTSPLGHLGRTYEQRYMLMPTFGERLVSKSLKRQDDKRQLFVAVDVGNSQPTRVRQKMGWISTYEHPFIKTTDQSWYDICFHREGIGVKVSRREQEE